MDAPSTTAATLTFVETAHLAAEIVEQLVDAKVGIYSFDVRRPTSIGLVTIFANSEADVDRAAEVFDLAPDEGGKYYRRVGTVRGVEVEVWSERAGAKA